MWETAARKKCIFATTHFYENLTNYIISYDYTISKPTAISTSIETDLEYENDSARPKSAKSHPVTQEQIIRLSQPNCTVYFCWLSPCISHFNHPCGELVRHFQFCLSFFVPSLLCWAILFSSFLPSTTLLSSWKNSPINTFHPIVAPYVYSVYVVSTVICTPYSVHDDSVKNCTSVLLFTN